MLTLDKIKLVTRLDYVLDVNEEEFSQQIENDTIVSMKYSITTPYQLYVEVDYNESELVIEFSGKLLGEDYHKLISLDTIVECFEAINAIGICRLDIDAIINDADVVKCDVTKDVLCDNSKGLTTFLNGNITSHQKYNCRRVNGNLVVDKNVTTPAYKKRLVIYDKEKEMNKMDNQRFAERYNCNMEDFRGRVRFELNLNTKQQIRRALNISDNKLMSVLNAQLDPIADFVDEILADDDGRTPSSRKEYEAELVLRDCGYDIKAVEAKLKAVAGKNFHPKRDLEIHRKILAQMGSNADFSKEKVLEMVRGVSK